MAIKIVRNSAGNCVNFVGSTNPVYFNACLSGEIDSSDANLINVKNDIRTVTEGQEVYEFYQIPYTEFRDADNNSFATATECSAYITDQCNVSSNTGQFILSSDDTLDFSLDPTETTVLLDNGDAYAVNSIRAAGNDEGKINILQHTGSAIIFRDLEVANASINGVAVDSVLATAVNELNALFVHSGGALGSAPVITSSTSVNINQGDTLNYELVASNGVAYEWSNLPSGVASVDGNIRKIIGGSTLSVGTYTVTATAINYFGQDSQDIDIIVSNPPFSNTKSIQFNNLDYLGANAALLDAELGRSGNGAGSGDAWTIALWFKSSTNSSGQTIFYYGSNDVTNGGYMELRFVGGTDKLRLRYGSNNNYIQVTTPNDSMPPNTWKHIVVTYDGGTTGASSADVSDYYSRFEIFINGVSQTLNNSHSNYGWSGAISGQNLRVGRLAAGNYLQDNSKVEELAIWGSDQTANVSDIYNSGSTHDLSQLTTSPSHWWRMGDGDTYPTIQDNVGTAHFVQYNMTAADIVNDVP